MPDLTNPAAFVASDRSDAAEATTEKWGDANVNESINFQDVQLVIQAYQ